MGIDLIRKRCYEGDKLKFISSAARAILDRFGYVLWKRDFIRYGVLPFLDIDRLSKAFGRNIEVFFDVGANIGQTSVVALKSFPDAVVFAFEPASDTFSKLSDRIRTNNRFFPHQIALGDKEEEATLYEYREDVSAVARSLVLNGRFPMRYGFHQSGGTKVTCRTIDQFCRDASVRKIDVLKIDVEGFELSVIKGAERMLNEGRIGFVYLEFNDLMPKDGTVGGSLFPISEYLSQFGLKYVASYTDFIHADHEMFSCANALFALPPDR